MECLNYIYIYKWTFFHLPFLPWFPSTTFMHKEIIVIVVDLFQNIIEDIHVQCLAVKKKKQKNTVKLDLNIPKDMISGL